MRKGTRGYKSLAKYVHAVKDNKGNTWCGRKGQPQVSSRWPDATCPRCLKAGHQPFRG